MRGCYTQYISFIVQKFDERVGVVLPKSKQKISRVKIFNDHFAASVQMSVNTIKFMRNNIIHRRFLLQSLFYLFWKRLSHVHFLQRLSPIDFTYWKVSYVAWFCAYLNSNIKIEFSRRKLLRTFIVGWPSVPNPRIRRQVRNVWFTIWWLLVHFNKIGDNFSIVVQSFNKTHSHVWSVTRLNFLQKAPKNWKIEKSQNQFWKTKYIFFEKHEYWSSKS